MPSNTQLHCNSITNNGVGVENQYTVAESVILAENNWWGHASGPAGEGSGAGDPVGTNVDFDPWLDGLPEFTPPCAAPPTVGGTTTATRVPYVFAPLAALVLAGVVGSAGLVWRRRRADQ